MRRSTRRTAALSALAALALPLAACSGGGGGAEAAKTPPAKLIAVTGTDQKQVVLTPKAAERIGLQTSPAGEGSHAGGPTEVVVPYSALVYDAHGAASVYTTPAPLTFLRVPVTIDTIDGNSVYLTQGPPAGTAVVTIGAVELFGSELGIGQFE
jgi:hypothetical protein